MIKNKSLIIEDHAGCARQLAGEWTGEDCVIKMIFKQSGMKTHECLARAKGGTFVSDEAHLERGIYDIEILQEGQPAVIQVLENILIGNRYEVHIRKVSARMYGKSGTRVIITGSDYPEDISLEYKLHNSNIPPGIKYKVTLGKKERKEFFIICPDKDKIRFNCSNSCIDVKEV